MERNSNELAAIERKYTAIKYFLKTLHLRQINVQIPFQNKDYKKLLNVKQNNSSVNLNNYRKSKEHT